MNASMREFLIWVDRTPRTYADAMRAWQSSCPRFSIWEDALDAGLVHVRRTQVVLTEQGQAALGKVKPTRAELAAD
jgi:hypothetical protein